MCADFYYYLNRQGLQGRDGARGEKGEPGNTPTFRTGVNTPTVYTLIVDSGDGVTFETGNLKYPMRDNGGDYLRYDRDDATVVLDNPNYADLQGNVGEVKLASVEDHEGYTAEDTDAVSYELFKTNNEDLDTRMDGIDGEIERVDGRVTREIQDRDDADTVLSDRIYLLDTNKANKSDVYTKTQTDNLLAGKANTQHTHTLSQITNAGTLASKNTVDYQTEVTNKPTIPNVGNGTITITQGGITKGTFTMNQSNNSTIELEAGGGGGATYTEGNGINIIDDVISAKVDGNTINFDSGGHLTANIPDVSNFVTNSSLANTLEAYPTNQALSNLVDYETVTVPGQDSWVPLSLSNCRYNNPYDTITSFEIRTSEYEVQGILSKLNPGMVSSTEETVMGNIVFQNSYRQAAYFKTRRLYFDRYSLLTYFYINGILENGDTIQFDNANIPSDIATYSNGYLDFNVDVYISSFVARYTFFEGYFDGFETKIFGEPNELGGYLYNIVQGEPTTITKAIIADTAVDGSTITVNSSGQLQANIPVVPTPNDATITITQGGVTKGSFTTNQGTNGTIALDAGPDMSGYYTKTEVDSNFIANDIVSYPLQYSPEGVHPASLSLKYDSNTLGVNANGELYGISSTPSNMVTTDTAQTITGRKSFNIIDAPNLNIGNTSGSYFWTVRGGTGYSDIIMSNNVPSSGNHQQIRLSGHNLIYEDYLYDRPYITSFVDSNKSLFSIGLQTGTNAGELNLWQYGARAGINNTFTDKRIYKGSLSNSSTLTNFLLEKDMLDGTTIQYNSTSGKVEVIGGGSSYTLPIASTSTLGGVKIDGTTITIDGNGVISAAGGGDGSVPIRKTITQASANISESSGTVTVTDVDVTTSTIVTLYPSDTVTETWLADNLASNIITEGSGSFTFTINGTLPATFSMYYIIQEVD